MDVLIRKMLINVKMFVQICMILFCRCTFVTSKTEKMTTITLKNEKQLKSFVNQNRESITNINGVEFGNMYPILTCTKTNASYYDVETQGNKFLSAPFTIHVKN